jgi:tRNA nucleotidyltransferase/poly(A) polymerase
MTTDVDTAQPLQALVAPARMVREALGDSQRAWLVGGVVRDALLNRELLDLDIVVDGDAGDPARRWARLHGGTPFPLSDRFGCWRVTDADVQLDVCSWRDGSLDADLAARDFAANAVAVDVAEPLVAIDPHGGVADIASRTLRMVSTQGLDDDPLRLLRAARIAHTLGFTIDDATVAAIRERALAASTPSGERIFAELCLLVEAPESRRALRLLDDLGLVASLLPELERCKGCEQSRYHHLDVFEHTIAVLDNVEDIAAAPSHYLGSPPHVPEPVFDDGVRRVLRFAALAHDLGKPDTHTVNPDTGRIGFVGHDSVGVDIVDAMCERWATSNRFRDALRLLTRTHLALGWLLHGDLDARASWRYRRHVDPYAAEAIVLSVADRLATAGLDDRRRWVRAHVSVAQRLWADHWAEVHAGIPSPLLNGDEIAEAAGITPGPQLGELVKALAQEQAASTVTTVDEAREFVRARARSATPER